MGAIRASVAQVGHKDPGLVNARLPVSLIDCVVVTLCVFVVAAAWALSGPPGSSWTEREQLATIWCRGGETAGCSQDEDEPEEFQIKKGLAGAPCFEGDGNSARCLSEVERNEKEGVLEDEMPNEVNPFHKVLRPLITTDPFLSVIRMRMMMAVLCAAMAGSCLYLLGKRGVGFTRFWLLAWLPVGLYQVSSIVPTGWSLLGVAFSSAGGFALLCQPSSIRLKLLATGLLGVGATLAVLGGGNGFLIACISAILPVIFSFRSRSQAHAYPSKQLRVFEAVQRRGATSLFVAILLLIGILIQQHLTRGSASQGSTGHFLESFLETFYLFPDFLFGFMGGPNYKFGLNDTRLPLIGSLAGTIAIGTLIVILWAPVAHRLNRIVTLGIIGLVALALYQVWEGVRDNNDGIQTITFLPCLTALGLAYSLTSSREIYIKAAMTIGGLGVVAYSVSLWRVIRRFAAGLPDETGLQSSCLFCQLPSNRWWWDDWYPRAVGPEITWLLGVTAIAVLFAQLHQLEVEDSKRSLRLVMMTRSIFLILSVTSAALMIQPWV